MTFVLEESWGWTVLPAIALLIAVGVLLFPTERP